MDLSTNYNVEPARAKMIGFGEAIGRAFSNFATFSGRATRAEFWWFQLFAFLTNAAAIFIDSTIFNVAATSAEYGPAQAILWLVLLIPSISLTTRRLHDINRTGWWQLFPWILILVGAMFAGAAPTEAGIILSGIVAFTGVLLIIALFVFTLMRGTIGSNRYGSDPYSV